MVRQSGFLTRGSLLPRAFPSFASCVHRVSCVIATDATTRHAIDVSRIQTVANLQGRSPLTVAAP